MADADTIVGVLKRNAKRFAERPALVDGDRSLTYAQLWQRVRSRAGFLRLQGVKPGDRVALVLHASLEYVVSYYAAMAVGAIAVPLNAAARARDLCTWIRHADVRCVLALAAHPETQELQLELGTDIVLCLDQLRCEADDSNDTLLAATEMPACILYTSGTTGAPKGVLLTHANLASNTAAILNYLHLRESDSIVCILPFYYSYGSSVLHTHLQAGACVVIEPNLIYPHLVVESMARRRVTGFAGVPSTFSLLLERVALEHHDLTALRYVTQAGGPMAPSLVQRLRQKLPDTEVFVMYGQTEATARLTYLPPAQLDRKLGSVGIAVDGVSLQVRSESGVACVPHEIGEVWAQGPSVMAGYWRNEEATAAVLRNGWLNTGDVGYKDAEGYLFLAGRRSDIIKTGAHRVHPQDVEEKISELAEVAEVAVVGVDDNVLGHAIKAMVVAAAGRQIDPLKVKAHCRQLLAAYKVPKYVEIVASLPKTASGKIRRRDLQSEGAL